MAETAQGARRAALARPAAMPALEVSPRSPALRAAQRWAAAHRQALLATRGGAAPRAARARVEQGKAVRWEQRTPVRAEAVAAGARHPPRAYRSSAAAP